MSPPVSARPANAPTPTLPLTGPGVGAPVARGGQGSGAATPLSPASAYRAPAQRPAFTGNTGLRDEAGLRQLEASIGSPGGRGPSGPERAARREFGRTANTSYDLDDRAQVRQLITNTPQVDSIRNTTNDGTRCGGASMMNALLADGNHAANATAIERVAANMQPPRRLDADEARALNNYRAGSMSPRDNAHLQEVMYDLGRTPPGRDGMPRYTAEGLTPNGMLDLSGRLRAQGAFGNTESMRFQFNRGEDGSHHWTVTHRDQQAHTLSMNSWPDATGHASVTDGRGPQFIQSGRFNPAVEGDVYVQPQGARTYYQLRAPDGADARNYMEMRASVPTGQAPDLSTDYRLLQRRVANDATIAERAPGTWATR